VRIELEGYDAVLMSLQVHQNSNVTVRVEDNIFIF